jgi:predicted O-methyltransferase YrrM
MEDYACQRDIPIIQAGGARLLVETVKKNRPKRILEIGTAIGYSTLLIAKAMAEDGEIVTLEQDPGRLKTAGDYFLKAGVENKIRLINGDAGKLLDELDGVFDLVFIDAAKGQYLHYLQKVIPKLAAGAVVIADNVLFRGWVLTPAAAPRRFKTIVKRLRQYIEFICNDSCFISEIYEAGDGLAISYYQGANKCEKT